MFTKHLNRTIISFGFSGFRDQDEKFFYRYCDLWFKMANSAGADSQEAEQHLLSILIGNSVALGEQSETISNKWIALLKTDPTWESLLLQNPFKVSIQKVTENLFEKS